MKPEARRRTGLSRGRRRSHHSVVERVDSVELPKRTSAQRPASEDKAGASKRSVHCRAEEQLACPLPRHKQRQRQPKSKNSRRALLELGRFCAWHPGRRLMGTNCAEQSVLLSKPAGSSALQSGLLPQTFCSADRCSSTWSSTGTPKAALERLLSTQNG